MNTEVPTSTTLLVSARPGYLARSLLRFQSAGLPPAGTVVDSASLTLPYREGFGTSPFSMTIHRVNAAWLESVIVPDSLPAIGAALDTVDVPFEEPVLDTLTVAGDSIRVLAQAWVADTTSNFGIALAPADGEDGELALLSREANVPPLLTIHWTVAGRDTSVNVAAVADMYSLGTTPAFTPLDQVPRRVTVACGFPARTHLKFTWEDLGARATVHRAELTLHIDNLISSGRSLNAAVRRLTEEPWTGPDTPADATLQGGTTVSVTADSVTFDVTRSIIQLLSNENHGFEVRAIDERPSTYFIRFHAYDTEDPAKAPHLSIWYTPGDLPEESQ